MSSFQEFDQDLDWPGSEINEDANWPRSELSDLAAPADQGSQHDGRGCMKRSEGDAFLDRANSKSTRDEEGSCSHTQHAGRSVPLISAHQQGVGTYAAAVAAEARLADEDEASWDDLSSSSASLAVGSRNPSYYTRTGISCPSDEGSTDLALGGRKQCYHAETGIACPPADGCAVCSMPRLNSKKSRAPCMRSVLTGMVENVGPDVGR